MTIKTVGVALNGATSIRLLLFPATDDHGHVPVLELTQGTEEFVVHFGSVVLPEMLGIQAAYDEIDPGETDAAIQRRAIVEIRRAGEAVEFRLRVGEYAANCLCACSEIPDEFFD